MAQKFYTTRCIGMCQHDTLHTLARHHSGETLLECTECKSQRPFPARRKRSGSSADTHQPDLFRKNPASVRSKSGAVESARRLLRDFAGREPLKKINVTLPKPPRAGLVFGQLIQVGYRSRRDGALYRHTFRSNKSRPLLIASHDGKSLHIVGGRYRFTDRGIEDA